jgi:hypothetical protein
MHVGESDDDELQLMPPPIKVTPPSKKTTTAKFSDGIVTFIDHSFNYWYYNVQMLV